jgi:hypothetical protein
MHPINNRHLQNLWNTHIIYCTLQNIPFFHGENKLKRAGTHKTHKRRERDNLPGPYPRVFSTRGHDRHLRATSNLGRQKSQKPAGLVLG